MRGVWKQLRGEWGVDFPLESVAADAGVEHELDPARLVVESREEIAQHLPRLAAFVRRYARELLAGDSAAYRRMARIGRERRRELTRWAAGN